MQEVASPDVGRQDRSPVDRDVTHRAVARRLSVLRSPPIGTRIRANLVWKMAEGPSRARIHILQ